MVLNPGSSSILYTRMPRLFADLAIAHGDARYARLLRSLARVKLLILDDWGPEALTPDQARDLLEIVEDRYDKGSLIITSQVPVDRWHDLIGFPRSPTTSSTASSTTPIASISPARVCASDVPHHEIEARGGGRRPLREADANVEQPSPIRRVSPLHGHPVDGLDKLRLPTPPTGSAETHGCSVLNERLGF